MLLTCLELLLGEIVPLLVRAARRVAPGPPGQVLVLDDPAVDGEDVVYRVELYGYAVGLRVLEVLLHGESRTRLGDVLDVMKFICRDVWRELYGKQMDNLRTNHRGTYVLVDSRLRLIARMELAKGVEDTVAKARPYVAYPCGIIRGILALLGVPAQVTADIGQFPSVSFNIQTETAG